MVDFIIIAIIAVIVGAAGFYVYKAKKSGKKCIGCPGGCSCSSENAVSECSGSCSCCCGCDHGNTSEEN